MSNVFERSLKLHEENRGKFEIKSKVTVSNPDELSLAYSPGVAEPCRKIHENKDEVYRYTNKGNLVPIVTDGSAVLGLGNIGPEAALPVMEGKAILIKQFGNVDAFPICLDTQDTEEIIKACKLIAPGVGGILLEDISAPRCVEIERRLKKELNIPVFHDDQHGTAIVTIAALINACRLSGKNISDLVVVVSGAGAAGSSIIRMLHDLNVKDIIALNSKGIIHESKKDLYNDLTKELLTITNKRNINGTIADALVGADVFIGVSLAGLVTKEMVQTMNKAPFIFAMANPVPEIMPEEALEAGALVVGTGRSDYPNQINNVLAFPGLFRGALDCRATTINDEMKLAAANAIALLIEDNELRRDYIIPSPFDKRVAPAVSKAVIQAAIETNVAKIF